jgi:heavy metal sensor kinase
MKKLSIGMRLTLWYLAIFLVAQIAFGAGMWFMLRHHLYDLVDDGLQDQVDDLRSLLQSLGNNPPLDRIRGEVNEAYSTEHLGNYLSIFDANGNSIYQSETLRSHPVKFAEAPQLNHTIFRNTKIDHRHLRFALARIEANGTTYVAQMGTPSNEVVETLKAFRAYLLMFAPALFLLAAAGGYWLSRKALSPVDSLVRTARDISGTNLNSRLPALETGDELQRLSDTLNGMLERIEAAFQRITEFTADASHELRTPISLIRTEAEVALRRSRQEAEYREALEHILREAERTTSLIEQLLSLARADSGRETLQMEKVDLAQTLRAVVDSWQQVATIRNVRFSATIDAAECFVLGDETLLRRVADILLDNAFKYIVAPATIDLSLRHDNGDAVIAVRDAGIGIDKSEHEKIFERFYRVDKARSRAQGGAGLGLSIAEWIVTQHRGSITVESEPGRGAIFSVKIPLAAIPTHNAQPA